MANKKVFKRGIKPLNIYDLGGMVDTSGIQEQINAQKAYVSNSKDLDSILQEYNTGLLNKISAKDLGAGKISAEAILGAAGSGASLGATFGANPIVAGAGALVGIGTSLFGNARKNRNAKREANRLNNNIAEANTAKLNSLNNTVFNIDKQNDMTMAANYAANGGNLSFQHGGEFSNGIMSINNGGTHEQNPMEGVLMGVDDKGTPNLVEEGETIFNDYVFSNRLTVPEEFKKKYKLGNKNMTFSEAVKKLQKESKERPNDAISKNGLNRSMANLTEIQENVKQQSLENMFKEGGFLKNWRNNVGWQQAHPIQNWATIPEQQKPVDFVQPIKKATSSTQGQNTPKQSIVFNLPAMQGLELPSVPEIPSEIKLSKDVQERLNAPIKEYSDTYFENTNKNLNEWARKAPIIGSGLSVLSDLTGLTNKPDYSNIENIGKNITPVPPIDYNPIGDYQAYNPFDRNYYTNKLQANAAASRRDIINQAGGNRATAMANLIAQDYNTQTKMGELFQNSEEYNQNQKLKIGEFNRGTNQYNSQAAFNAASQNAQIAAQNNQLLSSLGLSKAQMKEALKESSNTNRSANLTNLLDNLGALGTENIMKDLINKNPALLYTYTGAYKKKNGGKLNKRK